MTKALDYFDPAGEHGHNLAEALAPSTCDYLVVSFTLTGDFLRSAHANWSMHWWRLASRSATPKSTPQGHDAFLIPIPRYMEVFGGYMNRIANALPQPEGGASRAR